MTWYHAAGSLGDISQSERAKATGASLHGLSEEEKQAWDAVQSYMLRNPEVSEGQAVKQTGVRLTTFQTARRKAVASDRTAFGKKRPFEDYKRPSTAAPTVQAPAPPKPKPVPEKPKEPVAVQREVVAPKTAPVAKSADRDDIEVMYDVCDLLREMPQESRRRILYSASIIFGLIEGAQLVGGAR